MYMQGRQSKEKEGAEVRYLWISSVQACTHTPTQRTRAQSIAPRTLRKSQNTLATFMSRWNW